MCASPSSRRAVAEISAGGGSAFNIGNRSIHQFWHQFSSNFRSVLLPPQRRPDSGSIAWTWREPAQNPPLTAQELAAVRQRLNDGSRVFSGGGKGKVLIDDASGNLDSQVREKVGEMVAQLIAKGDQALAGFVCRTETGPMVHSWGAATPAQPHYPGTSEGAVSGTVFLGENRPAGLSVVLENRTGGFVARTKSGDAGAFSFPNVAPGSYRVRVTGREGFPAGGVAVTMEREPVTGIELRGKTGEDGAPVPAANVTTPPMAVETTPSRLPRLIGWLALLAVAAGGGFYYWRTTKQPASVAGNDPKQSGWQSARGQLASGASQPDSADTRKVGSDGRFSELGAAPSLPTSTASASAKPGSKPLVPTTVSAKNTGTKDTLRRDATAAPESSAPTAPPLRPEKSTQPAATGKPSQGTTTAAEKNKAGLTPQDRPASTETASASKEPAAPDEPGEAKTAQAEKSAAESAAKAKIKTPRTAAPGAPSPIGEPAADALPSGAAEPPSAAPAAVAASAASANNSSNPVAAKNAPGSGPRNATAADAGAPAADTPDSPAATAPADSAPKSSAGKSPASAKSPAANASASPASASPAENTTPDASTDSVDQSSDPASSAKNNPAKKSASAPKRPPGATPANPSPPPDATAPDDTPADSPAAANAGKPAAKPARPSATKTASASPETKASTAADSGDTPAASTEPDPDAPANSAKSPARSKPPQKSQPASPAESGPDGSPVASTKPAVIHEPLFPLARIGASDWKPRQVRDLVLPTQPVPASEDDAVQALREKLRLEQRARMPQTFRQPVVTSGFAVEFLASPSIDPPRWRDANGAQPASATVQGNRAEIAWSGPNPAGSIDYVLSYPDGREIARVHTDGDGAPSLTAAAGVRGWYWVGITRSPTDNKAASASPQPALRLDWRLLSGAAVPASWPQHDQWAGGQGHRLEIPLGASSADKRPYSLALVDQVTGWALVSEVRVR